MSGEIVLLCGPAFSGKTTLSRALAARGLVRLSLDDLVRARGLDPGEGIADADWGEAVAEVCRRMVDLGREAARAVLDDTSCYRWLRDRYREAAATSGLRARLVVLRIDPPEVLRRVEANLRHPWREGVRDAVLREHLARFEWPSPEEQPLEIDARWPLDRQLDATERGLEDHCGDRNALGSTP